MSHLFNSMFAFAFIFLAAELAVAEPQIAINSSDLTTYIEKARVRAEIPGMAVGIVKDDQLVYSAGFGLRDVENKLPVTTNTLFAIGSTTKAMTSTLIGMLVDEGRLRFDQPIQEFVSDFRLKDQFVTMNATMIDILSHRTGVPRHDLVWYGFDSFPRKYFWDRMRFLEPSKGFREAWQYNNHMYMAAGYIAEQISGQTWESMLRNRLFNELGMSASSYTIEEMERSSDFSRPYQKKAGVVTRVPMRPLVGMAPAGAVNSNVVDMAKWLALNMNQGSVNGKQLIQAATLNTIHQPHMIIAPRYPPYDEFSTPLYGLGWMRQLYRGHDLIWHTGGIDGFLTFAGFFPKEKIGIIVFQNGDFRDAFSPVAFRMMDEALGLEPIDWAERYLAQPQPPPTATATAEVSLIRPAADYIGVYVHPAYGEIAVSEVNGRLALKFHDLTFSLRHLGNGSFRLESDQLDGLEAFEPLFFAIDSSGKIVSVNLRLEPAVPHIVFARAP